MAAKNSVLFVCLGNICRTPIGDLATKKGARDQVR